MENKDQFWLFFAATVGAMIFQSCKPVQTAYVIQSDARARVLSLTHSLIFSPTHSHALLLMSYNLLRVAGPRILGAGVERGVDSVHSPA